jgi:hypothetical protein
MEPGRPPWKNLYMTRFIYNIRILCTGNKLFAPISKLFKKGLYSHSEKDPLPDETQNAAVAGQYASGRRFAIL